MFSDLENSRPRPPFKGRRATSNTTKHELTTTPPPAYGSTFVFPPRNPSSDFNRDIFGSPISSTVRMLGWDSRDSSVEKDETISQSDDPDWMNQKSREELRELLLKAHGIIRERETEVGRASTIVKQIYESNVVLKSKHEALLARIPMSVSTQNTHSRTSTIRLSHSASESGLAGPFTTRTRKVSIAMADVSLLADQNVELLDKLQRLEEDATSADIAGRRELKRLEKEIAYLRDALETTQAKSEELEGKVHDAVTSDALRRKKEREAARHAERDVKEETNVLNFAPPGSKFGGPTERYTFLNAEGSPNHDRQVPFFNTPGRISDVHPNSEDTSDRALISQLLNKVKELEETNDRILQHQAETSNQLASVQQDAMNISKIYEFLSDDDAVELEWNPDGNSSDNLSKQETDPPTIRFRSLRRSIENSLSADGFFYPGGNLSTKTRKSVVGLFDDSRPTEGQPGAATKQMTYPALPSMSETHDRSSWTSSSSVGAASPPGPLSPLNFFSPLSQSQSDIPQIPTLQNELESKLGRGSWNWPGATHMRTESLSNFSQFSAPTTPSPVPGSVNRMLPEELDHASKFDESGTVSGLRSVEQKAILTSGNSLELSAEPPTPDVNDQNEGTPTQTALRLQHISQTLRSRKNRWVGRMLKDRKSRDVLNEKFPPSSTSISDLSRQHSDVVDPQAGDISIDTEVTKAESSERDNDATHDSPSGSTTTPQPRRGSEDPLNIESAVSKRHEQDGELVANKSFLFQVWLWIQFVVVVFFFIFAMAKRGPRSVLVAGGDERLGDKKRSVTRR